MKQLQTDFKTHLQTLNYSKGTIDQADLSLKQYLIYLKTKQIKLHETNSQIITSYFDYLHHRPNERRSGGLSPGYIKKHQHSLKMFYDFLVFNQEITSRIIFPNLRKGHHNYQIKILSQKQIQSLFNACENTLLGERDRVILAIYYGCGLRKQEGLLLKVEDLDLDKGQLLVRKSKNGYQRYVPLSDNVIRILDNYLFNVREKLLPADKQERAVLLTRRGKSLSENTAPVILKKLAEKAQIDNKLSLHTLRHSIATHLLENGMLLESISKFLGHRSLDSTQIYTHLLTKSE